MTKRGILLRLLMEELGIDPTLATFRDRLVLQKGVYLLHRLGLPTQFEYGWYLRGPYSTALTRAAFTEVVEPVKQGDSAHEDYALTPGTQEAVWRLRGLRDRCEQVGLPEDRWLELLASMHFFRHVMYFPADVGDRRANPRWLYGKLPTSKRAIFTEEEAVRAKEALDSEGIW